ncbi:MAG: histidine-tRNA ligase [uncultured bacterium]|nr:MAG: histidine-tRNA ligase [uncultured bacterium]
MVSQGAYFPQKNSPFVFIIPLNEEAKKYALVLTKDLRHHKIPCEIDLNAKKIQKSLQLATKLQANNALIIGDDEMNNKKAQFKDLNSREQNEINFDNIKIFIRNKYYNLKEQKA